MIIEIGQKKGWESAEVVLADPDYVNWIVCAECFKADMKDLQSEITRFIRRFDFKAFTKQCSGLGCKKTACCIIVQQTYIYSGYYCSTCSPLVLGTKQGDLSRVGTYGDGIDHGMINFPKSQSFPRLIQQLAQGKGLPERFTTEDAIRFFSSTAKPGPTGIGISK